MIDQSHQSGTLFRTLRALHPQARVKAVVGSWQHSKEMRSTALLPLALIDFGLLPARLRGPARHRPRHPDGTGRYVAARRVTIRYGAASAWQRPSGTGLPGYTLQVGLFSVVGGRSTPINQRLGPCSRRAGRHRLRPATWRSAGSTGCRRSTASRRAGGRRATGAPRRDRAERRPEPRPSPRQARAAHALAAAASRIDVRPCRAVAPMAELKTTVVLEPRFGGWGRDVVRCDTPTELAFAMEECGIRLVTATGGVVGGQVPPSGYTCDSWSRAGASPRRVVAARARRVAHHVALGARRVPVVPLPRRRRSPSPRPGPRRRPRRGRPAAEPEGGWTVLEGDGAPNSQRRTRSGRRASRPPARADRPCGTAGSGAHASARLQ